MNPVRLYLDVDGVINAHLAYVKWGGDIRRGSAMGYRIYWSDRMIEALGKLDLELHWTTTWRSNAPLSIGSLIGYGQKGAVVHPKLDPLYPTTFPSIDWKMDSIEHIQLREPGPFIHADDEFHTDRDNQRVRQYRDWMTEVGGLAIAPNPEYGITPDDIDRMAAFIEKAKTEEYDSDG